MQALLRTKRWQQGPAGWAWAAHLILRPQLCAHVEVASPVLNTSLNFHSALKTEERRSVSSWARGTDAAEVVSERLLGSCTAAW